MADIYSLCHMFPVLLLLHIKRTKLCKWRLPSHKLPLSREYEWTGVKRDAWDYLPARSVQHNGCWAGFQSIRGTQSSAWWGHNGPIKAPCSTGEKTVRHSINQYHHPRSGKVSPFSHPARRLGLGAIVVDADLWPAHDMLMQQRNVEMSECVCDEQLSISEFSHPKMFWESWCKRVSRRTRHMWCDGSLWSILWP